MKPYEFKRFYHPKFGRFVFQHKGTGFIIDNIFKPMKAIASSVFKKVAKPMAKKGLQSGISHASDKIGKKVAEKSGASSVFKKVAKPMAKKGLQSGISHASDKIGKKVAEKSGDLIMKQLSKMRQGSTRQQKMMPIKPIRQQEESTNMILNRLISGSGIKRRR